MFAFVAFGDVWRKGGGYPVRLQSFRSFYMFDGLSARGKSQKFDLDCTVLYTTAQSGIFVQIDKQVHDGIVNIQRLRGCCAKGRDAQLTPKPPPACPLSKRSACTGTFVSIGKKGPEDLARGFRRNIRQTSAKCKNEVRQTRIKRDTFAVSFSIGVLGGTFVSDAHHTKVCVEIVSPSRNAHASADDVQRNEAKQTLVLRERKHYFARLSFEIPRFFRVFRTHQKHLSLYSND